MQYFNENSKFHECKLTELLTLYTKWRYITPCYVGLFIASELTEVLHNSLVSSFDTTPAALKAQTEAPARGMEESLR